MIGLLTSNDEGNKVVTLIFTIVMLVKVFAQAYEFSFEFEHNNDPNKHKVGKTDSPPLYQIKL